MTTSSGITVRWPTLFLGALGLLAAGGGAAYLLLPNRPPAPTSSLGAPAPAPSNEPAMSPIARPPSNGPLPDVVVTLTPEAVERADIKVATATAGAQKSVIRVPAVIEPDAYKQVTVTPLVSGRVTRVMAQLGQQVARGQVLAEIFSPELAEAETRFISARSELEAHERELQRTEKLVEIGAASRQDLEHLHAEHTGRLTQLESARARLELLGLTSALIDGLAPGKEAAATTSIPAPLAGVVTERAANQGLNVDTTSKLFTIVDLSSVWVVANVYERDFPRVRVGVPAIVTTKAFPDSPRQGRVSYIDPQVDPQTRTARVRIELPNSRSELRLGMLADVTIDSNGTVVRVQVPKAAVQNAGDRTVVYVPVPNQPGRFIEREVRLGDSTDTDVEVMSGIKAGDQVVVAGSFLLRAERERLGLRGSSVASTTPPQASSGQNPQTARLLVTEKGFEPEKLTLRAGIPARITVVRTTEHTCGTEIVFPSLNITRALPLNEPVVIDFTPVDKETAFACGMNMLHGTITVQ